MSAPTKPVKAAGKRAPALAAVRAPIELPPDEVELLRCYRTMDQRRKDENLDLMIDDARLHPMGRCAGARPATTGIRLAAVEGNQVRNCGPSRVKTNKIGNEDDR